MTARSAGDNSWSLAIEINSCMCEAVFAIVLDVFRVYKKSRPNWDANS